MGAKTFATTLILTVVTCCYPSQISKSSARIVPKPVDSIHWSISVTHDANLVPKSVMYLILNKKSVWYAVVQGNEMKPFDSDYLVGWNVPKNVIAVCFGWYAGAGDLFYIRKHNHIYRIYHRVMDESDNEITRDRLVKTIKA